MRVLFVYSYIRVSSIPKTLFSFFLLVFPFSSLILYHIQRFQYSWYKWMQQLFRGLRVTSKWRLSVHKMYASTKSNRMLAFLLKEKRRERQFVWVFSFAHGGCFLYFRYFSFHSFSFSFDEANYCNSMRLFVAFCFEYEGILWAICTIIANDFLFCC